MKFPAHLWIREVGVTTSVSQQWEKMREIKSVSLNRPAAIATQTETGEFDGIYLPYNYVAQMDIDGKPLYVTASARTAIGFPVGGITECDEYGDGMELSEEFGRRPGIRCDTAHQ